MKVSKYESCHCDDWESRIYLPLATSSGKYENLRCLGWTYGIKKTKAKLCQYYIWQVLYKFGGLTNTKTHKIEMLDGFKNS